VHMTSMPSIEMWMLAGRAVFLVFSFVLAAITFTAWRRSTRRQTDQIMAHSETLLQRLAALEARVDAVAITMTRLDERFERQGPPGASASQGYQIAIRLARGGASRDELMTSCGLSLGEAELVRRLHGMARAANA
jgi:predicted negative regulator of RcsB-dependent stress response